ncbi:MAG: hypothetical protein P8H59_08065 [Flavobacteriales bacterium]|nr:hypothetical protein [Flavobacteriales bacterium]MDG2244803.1 hypothetical protein [Flavobacteriales bacterium]
MKRTIHPLLATTAAFGLLFASCGDEPKDTNVEDVTQEVSVEEANENAVTSKLVKLDSEIFSLPSPVQTAVLLSKSEIPYNDALLNPVAKVNSYMNQSSQALNLGVYGADLAYLSNYNNAQLKLDYFKVVEDLATELNIRNNIDQSLIDRFASNIDSRDSLYKLNANLFKAADQYLKQNDEEEVAALVLSGGWIEALHLSMQAAESNDAMRNRIGEQGTAVRSIVNLLKRSTEPSTLELAAKMAALAELFEGLNMTYTYVKPIPDASQRISYLNSKSKVELSDEQLALIAVQVDAIRNMIIQ